MATIATTRRTVSATEARVHFGEMLERVVDRAETVVVERHGRPAVVMLPVERLDALERIEADHADRGWTIVLDEVHAYVRERFGDHWLEGLDLDELIDGGRDDVD